MPLKLALGFGSGLGKLGYLLRPERNRLAYENLKLAFKKENKKVFTAIIRGVYSNLGRNMIEVLRFPLLNSNNIGQYVDVRGVEHMNDALNKGKGVIMLTAHFGNWELASLTAALMGYPMKVLAREQKFERLNKLLNSYRQLKGCEVIPKGMAIREIVRHLKQNGIIGMLSDQDGGRRGVFVDFFGRHASTPAGAIEFALRTGCLVLPGFIIREEKGKHRINIEPPLNINGYAGKEEAVREGLQNFASILESYVRRYPDQWLWLHNRWKTRP
jgi:KDO2-lipid IV(A) lauroyltransferase